MNPERIYALAHYSLQVPAQPFSRRCGWPCTPSSVSEALRGFITMNVIEFADENIRLNEKGRAAIP